MTYRKRTQSELKAFLLKRAETRKAYACHGQAKAFDMPHAISAEWDGTRFVDSLEDAGLRLVGTSYDLLRHYSRHIAQGWYTDEFQQETFKGVVLQLPSRNGCPQYVEAYQESCNDGYVVNFHSVGDGPKHGEDSRYDHSQELRDVAWAADSMAERAAEKAREYNEAWQAGSRWSAMKEEEERDRSRILELAKEIRLARRDRTLRDIPNVCAALREKILDLYESIQRSRAKREKLADEIWHEYRDAFNDGAQETVLA